MTGGVLPNINIQTVYVSKEISNCPLIANAINFDKNIKKSDLFEKNSDTTISLRYGKRILINGKNSLFGELKQEDFLEIVDYDPLKKMMLLIGPKEPKFDTTIHWLIHYAKKEVNAIVQINCKKLVKRIKKRLPEIKGNYHMGSLELAKEILKEIRNNKGLIINKNGIFFVGKDIDEIEMDILKISKE